MYGMASIKISALEAAVDFDQTSALLSLAEVSQTS